MFLSKRRYFVRVMEKDMFRCMGSKMMIFQNVENEGMSIRWGSSGVLVLCHGPCCFLRREIL